MHNGVDDLSSDENDPAPNVQVSRRRAYEERTEWYNFLRQYRNEHNGMDPVVEDILGVSANSEGVLYYLFKFVNVESYIKINSRIAKNSYPNAIIQFFERLLPG